jgi:tetratricopeptide (TPR) repeat protein
VDRRDPSENPAGESRCDLRTFQRQSWTKPRGLLVAFALLGLQLVPAIRPKAVGGDWYENRLLANGGARMLAAPEAVFVREIQTFLGDSPGRRGVDGTNGPAPNSAEAELADLQDALRARGATPEAVDAVVRRHRVERDKLQEFVAQRDAWRNLAIAGPGQILPSPPFLAPGAIRVHAGLPAEFAEYFRGAIAWHSGDTNTACAIWELLLKRPATERRFRSTWAAFMLGKAAWESRPNRGVQFFQKVRALAQAGFADSLDLATSSLGWEARIEMRRQAFGRAIDLYLEQAAAGDESAFNSLRFAAAAAVTDGARSLQSLATQSNAQRVITAWMISGGWQRAPVDVDSPIKEPILNWLARQSLVPPPGGDWHTRERPVRLWLEAVEAAQVRDAETAEKLALLAYQAEELEIARRWIARAPAAPTAQWIEAKLLIRARRIDDAAAILARLVRRFPADRTGAQEGTEPLALAGRLHASGPFYWHRKPAPVGMLGELGALQLAQSEYTEALDALLRAGYERDARYVADRVLTLPELQAYVDRYWPEQPPTTVESLSDYRPYTERYPDQFRQAIRHLLAMRLLRAGRTDDARAYFPRFARSILDEYLQALAEGRDVARPAAHRAEALRQAAQIVRSRGYALFAAPAETDWRVRDGLFNSTADLPARFTPAGRTVLPTSFDERLRAVQSAIYPVRSWHCGFLAAELAWEAAQLMPNESDDTARLLWEAGTWIKYLDPQAADRFYKALVQRCSTTELGRLADRRRWFPTAKELATAVAPPEANP